MSEKTVNQISNTGTPELSRRLLISYKAYRAVMCVQSLKMGVL